MNELLLIVHALLVLALIGTVLVQKNEGGGLGIGGGGGGGVMSGRSAANFWTKTTAILAALFFISSLSLTLLMNTGGGSNSLTDRLRDAGTPGAESTLPSEGGDVLPGTSGGTETPAPGGTAPGVE